MNTLSSITSHVRTDYSTGREGIRQGTAGSQTEIEKKQAPKNTEVKVTSSKRQWGKEKVTWNLADIGLQARTEWIWGLHVPITKIKTVAELARY